MGLSGNVAVRKHTRRRTGRSAEIARRLGFPDTVTVEGFERRRPPKIKKGDRVRFMESWAALSAVGDIPVLVNAENRGVVERVSIGPMGDRLIWIRLDDAERPPGPYKTMITRVKVSDKASLLKEFD